MLEYVVTVPKRHFNQIKLNTSPSNARIKPILGICIPKNAHTHEWYCISSVSRFKKKKEKKKLTYQPVQLSGKKGKQSFYFLGLSWRCNKLQRETNKWKQGDVEWVKLPIVIWYHELS